MAYNQVGTSRMYVSILQWLKSLGSLEISTDYTDFDTFDGDPMSLIDVVPSSMVNFSNAGVVASDQPRTVVQYEATNLEFSKIMPKDNNFTMVLGHNFTPQSDGGYVNSWAMQYIPYTNSPLVAQNLAQNGVNYSNYISEYLGYSVGFGLDNAHDVDTNIIGLNLYDIIHDAPLTISSVLYGSYWEAPHSPDLSLSISYETGTKTIETRGGHSLSNTMWRPPMWGDLGAWELSDPANPTTGQNLAHSSRRIWSLAFSYMDKTDTFPKYNALNRYANTEDLSDNDLLVTNNETLLDSDDFFSRVWNVVGTHSSFIFQPDNTIPEFAIAKFTKPISFQQQLPGLYRISLEIREVW